MNGADIFATPTGTQAFADRFSNHEFYNHSDQGLVLSSIGIGTYKGAFDEEGDAKWEKSIRFGLANGINVIDTAIRYRGMRSEKLIGRILSDLFLVGELQRSQVFISTKGGLIAFPDVTDRAAYVQQNMVKQQGVPNDWIYQNTSCLHPAFIESEINKSLQNLQLACVDCYFLHNPEMAFLLHPAETVYQNFYHLFEVLEQYAADCRIAAYGIASWNGFRRRPGSSIFLDLKKLLEIAAQVGGSKHHFRYLEFPLSVGMPFIYNNRIEKNSVNFLQYVRDLGLNILTSASMYEGNLHKLFALQRLMSLAGNADSLNEKDAAKVSLPVSENSIVQLFELLLALRQQHIDFENTILKLSDAKLNIYPAALNLVRSTPEVLCALGGMEQLDYATDNIQIKDQQRIDALTVQKFWGSLCLDNQPERLS